MTKGILDQGSEDKDRAPERRRGGGVQRQSGHKNRLRSRAALRRKDSEGAKRQWRFVSSVVNAEENLWVHAY